MGKNATVGMTKGKAHHPQSLEFVPIGSYINELPLPAKLTAEAALSEAREINESAFPTDKGKAQYLDLQGRGYRIMSWPDGTRAAYKTETGRNLNTVEGIYLYQLSREVIERQLANLQNCMAGSA
jgi:hypothetical protein